MAIKFYAFHKHYLIIWWYPPEYRLNRFPAPGRAAIQLYNSIISGPSSNTCMAAKLTILHQTCSRVLLLWRYRFFAVYLGRGCMWQLR